MVANREMFQNIKLHNKKWSGDLGINVTDASLSLSTGQSNELSISFDDPAFAYFGSTGVPLDSWVSFEKLTFSVASRELNAGGGEGGFTLTCRPKAIRNLKKRKGKKVMRNVSPSQWIASECKAVGVKYVTQPTGRRSSISRDIPEAGMQGQDDANSWSTFQRLADEVGFLCYEMEGVVYFGQPTWLIARMTTVYAVAPRSSLPKVPGPAVIMNEFPEADQSLDNDSRRTINFRVPLEQQSKFRPGRKVKVHGLPSFSVNYFITSVDFPLAGPGDVTVSAETPHNPDKR